MNRTAFFLAVLPFLQILLASPALTLEYPGPPPGESKATVESEQCRLENGVIAVSWQVIDGRFRPLQIVDRLSGKTIPGGDEVFSILLSDGRTIHASGMKLIEPPHCEAIAADPATVRASDHYPGKCISATLTDDDGELVVQWRAVLRDGASYVRQELSLRPKDKDLPLEKIVLGDLSVEGARTAGTVRGSPVVADNLFFACENPLAENRGEEGHIYCSLPWIAPVEAGKSFDCTSVVGVAPAGQMRRAFLCYIERERPRPYQPFLHYNSWYDISWTDRKIEESQCLAVIEIFCRELVRKRGVQLDSFVLDDGWDDSRTLWGFNAGFPRGFTPLRKAATHCGAGMGVWMSPWGGYDPFKTERLKYGREQGFEINRRGFSLAGPKYYARYFDTCRQMIEKYNVNFFKFDGLGTGGVYAEITPEDRADFAAMMRLTKELRRMRRDLYLSVTSGTWPSPYWLWYSDSVWRGGSDAKFVGQGTMRQQWMNYRDVETQKGIVRRAPLYPLNSLMNQGIMVAQLGYAAKANRDLKDVVDEFRMFFGCGTQLQELYMTPQILTPAMWDALAETANWSRNNADVLVDTHWIGGDADKSQPYGYASWSPRKGILCVRNPSNQVKTLTLKLADVFELPRDAPQRYTLKSPWKADAHLPARSVVAEAEYCLELQPFEVCILEATP